MKYPICCAPSGRCAVVQWTFPLFAAALFLTVGALPLGAQNTAVDPQTGVVHSARLLSGVPLGGLGAGKVEILTDGSFAHATIMNNGDCPTGNLPGCYAALWTRVGTQTAARALSLNNAYGLPTVAKLDFNGLAPQAQLSYSDPAIPLSVSLLAFTPLVPFILKDSSYPAAALVFRLKNTLPVPIEISVALSWEGQIGQGSDGRGHPLSNRTGVRVAAIPSAEGYFGLGFVGPRAEMPADAAARQRANANGEMALMTYPSRPDAAVTVAGWNALEKHPGWWDDFSREGDVHGESPTGSEGTVHPAGVVAVRLTLKPNDYVEVPFAVSWYVPHHWLPDGLGTNGANKTQAGGEDFGHYYQNVFDDAPQAARRLLDQWASLYALTEEWQKSLTFSNLPRWLARRLINSVAPLTADSVYTRDGRFALSPGVTWLSDTLAIEPADFNAAAQADTRQHLAANALLLAFFPTLDVQLLKQCGAVVTAYGSAPPLAGQDLSALLGPPLSESAQPDAAAMRTPARAPAGVPTDLLAAPIDSNSAYVLEIAQYTFWSGDLAFLKSSLPEVRVALRSMLRARDAAGARFHPGSLILSLAALKAGQRLAEMAENAALAACDHETSYGRAAAAATMIQSSGLAASCRDAAAHGVQSLEKEYWNGQCYGGGEKQDAAHLNCDPDQLLGQWIAYQLDLGALLPADHLAETLRTVEAGAGMGEQKGVVRLPEWAPLTLTLAIGALSLHTEQAEAGIALLHRLDDRRNNTVRAPWLFPQRQPDSSGTMSVLQRSDLGAAADWNLLYALEGFSYDATAGRMTLRPNLPGTWRTYSAPVFAPTFQGNLEYKPTAHGGLLNLRIDRLMSAVGPEDAGAKRSVFVRPALVLRSLKVPGPMLVSGQHPSRERAAYVSVGQRPIGCKTEADSAGQLTLTFDTELHLNAGDRLQVDVH